jgi:hypothetical protein
VLGGGTRDVEREAECRRGSGTGVVAASGHDIPSGRPSARPTNHQIIIEIHSPTVLDLILTKIIKNPTQHPNIRRKIRID